MSPIGATSAADIACRERSIHKTSGSPTTAICSASRRSSPWLCDANRSDLDGVEQALAVGLTPVKVDTPWLPVAERRSDRSDRGEVRGTGIIPRFIEYMDVGTTNG